MTGLMLTRLVSWFLGAFTRLFTLIVNNFLAVKVIAIFLFIIVLPIIINNALYDLMDNVFGVVTAYASTHGATFERPSFSGLLGYFIDQFGVVSCFSIIFSAAALRFAMSWIPFVGPK